MAITHHYLTTHRQPEETKIINGKPVRFSDVCVYNTTISDSDDLDILVSNLIHEWKHSESGSWIMEHAVGEPYFMQHFDVATYLIRFKIMARLSDPDYTFWNLKWTSR